jgi:phosphoribosylglycinamide formyltransferase-1
VSKRILLLASGAGSLAAAILAAEQAGKILTHCVGLISDKDSPALEIAREHNVPDFFISMRNPRSEWDREIFERTEELAPDLVVSVGFMRLLAPEYVSRFKVINTHPSLLPLFPGAHAVRDALAAGVSVTGTTVHWVDAGLDTGPVISQERIEVRPGEDESSLHERIKIAERALIVETLAAYGRTGTL